MKKITKAAVLMLVLSVMCMTFWARADEYDFFQAVIVDKNLQPVKARPVLVDGLLSVSIPSHWEEVESADENWMQYRCAGDAGESELYIAWIDNTEQPFEEIIEACKEEAAVCCKASRFGFEWQAFELPQGILVLHKGENGKNYALGLAYEGEKPAPDSAVAQDFHCIVDSFKPADAVSLSLVNAQKNSAGSEQETVEFEDPVFEGMLREALQLEADAPIQAETLEAVTKLFIHRGWMGFDSFSSISGNEQQVFAVSLADLKLFPNLTQLCVCDMAVTDLETLYACSELKMLELIGCGLQSCEILQPLTQLEMLSLARNEVASLDPIADMTRLTFLNLYCNPVEELSALSEMTHLQELVVSRTNLRTLEGLSGCTELEELTAQEIIGSKLSLKPLAQLKNLSWVDFNNTNVCDRECIAHVENVRLGNWW